MENVMKQYVYLWINKYLPINDQNENDGYIFSDIGVNLGSKYIFKHDWDGKNFRIELEKQSDFGEKTFSNCISDIKVFVGRNGSGKTSLLDFVYKNVGDGFGDVFPNVDYILFFIDENEVFSENGKLHLHYVSHKAGSFPPQRLVEIIDHSDDIEIFGEGICHKSDLAVFYSASFSDSEYASSNLDKWGDWSGTRNISTGGLLQIDRQKLNFLTQSFYKGRVNIPDRLSSYYIMEQNRNIDFLLETDDDFFSFFNIPNSLKMTIMPMAFEQIITELAQKNGNGNKEKENDEIGKWRAFYNELKSFDEELKFISLLNFLRYFNLTIPLESVKICFEQQNQNWANLFGQIHYLEEAVSVLLKVNEILRIIKKCLKQEELLENQFVFNIRNNKSELQLINKLYNEIPKFAPFLLFEFKHRLSSGEESLLKFFSRFYYALKQPENGKPINNVHLFVDEPDLYIHPEWQRKWLSRFIWGVECIERMLRRNIDVSNSYGLPFLKEDEKFRIQVFLTTHSPFIVTDFFTENIVFLNREHDGFGKTTIDHYKKDYTLGADIFDILRSGFFIDSVVGEFAEKRVRDIVDFIEKNPFKNREEIPYLSQIGDPILRGLLESTISKNDVLKSDSNKLSK